MDGRYGRLRALLWTGNIVTDSVHELLVQLKYYS